MAYTHMYVPGKQNVLPGMLHMFFPMSLLKVATALVSYTSFVQCHASVCLVVLSDMQQGADQLQRGADELDKNATEVGDKVEKNLEEAADAAVDKAAAALSQAQSAAQGVADQASSFVDSLQSELSFHAVTTHMHTSSSVSCF